MAAIDQQDDWTFEEVLGLANQFSLKTRYVIACVHSRGKSYIDGKRSDKTKSKDCE